MVKAPTWAIGPGQTPTGDPDQPDKGGPMGCPGPFKFYGPHYLLSKLSFTFVNEGRLFDYLSGQIG